MQHVRFGVLSRFSHWLCVHVGGAVAAVKTLKVKEQTYHDAIE